MEYDPVPIVSEHLYRYVAFLATFLKFRSVRQYLNIVRLLHVENGFANPLSEDVFLTGLMRGLRRLKGDFVNRKLPITLEIMLKVYGSLDTSNPKEFCFWTACLVAFYGMFRKASLFPRRKECNKLITLADCHVFDWGLAVYTRCSKTIQFQERQVYVSLPWNSNKKLCAARHIIKCVSMIPNTSPDTCIFSFFKNGKTVGFTYQLFTLMLRDVLNKIGLPPGSYSGHSFRRGGASLALKSGISPEMIKAQGDWKSLAYMDYLDISDCKDRAYYMQQMC